MESDLCFAVYETPDGYVKLRRSGNVGQLPIPRPGHRLCGIFEFNDSSLQIGGIYFEAKETNEEGLSAPFNIEQLLASLATP